MGGAPVSMIPPSGQALAAAEMMNMQVAANSVGYSLQNAMRDPITPQEAARYANTYRSPKPEPTVAQTAASRVRKSAWEAEQDAKDAEVDEWLASVKGKSDEEQLKAARKIWRSMDRERKKAKSDRGLELPPQKAGN